MDGCFMSEFCDDNFLFLGYIILLLLPLVYSLEICLDILPCSHSRYSLKSFFYQSFTNHDFIVNFS
jgi:hypothetical protein